MVHLLELQLLSPAGATLARDAAHIAFARQRAGLNVVPAPRPTGALEACRYIS